MSENEAAKAGKEKANELLRSGRLVFLQTAGYTEADILGFGDLAENLYKMLPGHPDVLSFGSGGPEAVEIALKTARAATGKKKFIYCDGSWHGVSYGSLSVCGTEKFNRYVGPPLPLCEEIPYGDLRALEAKLKEGNVAAFIVEPVQGEGGMRCPPRGYLAGAEELCRKYEALLILDEIQTGFGRTGRMFAAEHEDVKPDIITLGKALTAGVVPMSASATSEKIWEKAFGAGDMFELSVVRNKAHKRPGHALARPWT